MFVLVDCFVDDDAPNRTMKMIINTEQLVEIYNPNDGYWHYRLTNGRNCGLTHDSARTLLKAIGFQMN